MSLTLKAQWSLYVPSALTHKNSAFCPQSVPYGSYNKQRMFLQAVLTGWAL
jgi:hypothetical protein